LQDAAGETIGGLWASSFYDWLFVELLFIPEELRRHQLGSRMMKQDEQIAVARGCTGIWVDTFEFQAKGFYEQLGYSVFGTIEDYPRGTSRFFFRKRLG
jgi:GNAT superfamily N-acetyltransferase